MDETTNRRNEEPRGGCKGGKRWGELVGGPPAPPGSGSERAEGFEGADADGGGGVGVAEEGVVGEEGEEVVGGGGAGVDEAARGEEAGGLAVEEFGLVGGDEAAVEGFAGVDAVAEGVLGGGGGEVFVESVPVAPDDDVVALFLEDGGAVGHAEVGVGGEAAGVEGVGGEGGHVAEHVDGAGVGGGDAGGGEAEGEGDLLEGGVVAMEGEGVVGLGDVADVGDLPDKLDVVLGGGAVDTGGVGEGGAGSAAPALGLEVVEEGGVAADHPELAVGGFAGAVDVVDAPDGDVGEVGGAGGGGGGGGEAVALALEVVLAAGGEDFGLVLGGAGEELEVDEGVDEVAGVVAEEGGCGGGAGADDDVLGLDVEDAEAGLPHVGDGAAEHEVGEGRVRRDGGVGGGGGDGLGLGGGDALDPFIYKNILAVDVELDVAELGLLAGDLGLRAARLPELEALGGDVDGEGLLRADGAGAGGGAHLEEEGELLVGGVELGLDELVEGEGVDGDLLADTAPFDDEILRRGAGEGAGADAIDAGGALELFAGGGEPVRCVPAFRAELPKEGAAKRGDVEVRVVGELVVVVGDPEEGAGRGRGERRERGGRGIGGCDVHGREKTSTERRGGTEKVERIFGRILAVRCVLAGKGR